MSASSAIKKGISFLFIGLVLKFATSIAQMQASTYVHLIYVPFRYLLYLETRILENLINFTNSHFFGGSAYVLLHSFYIKIKLFNFCIFIYNFQSLKFLHSLRIQFDFFPELGFLLGLFENRNIYQYQQRVSACLSPLCYFTLLSFKCAAWRICT